MQVSVENIGTLERKLTVKFPAERFETQVTAAYRGNGSHGSPEGLSSGQGAYHGHQAALRRAGAWRGSFRPDRQHVA
jgi:hypothetical protein